MLVQNPLAELLLKKETLDYQDVEDLLGKK